MKILGDTIYFDMDGTIADLYGVEGWLDNILNSNSYPYENARPLIDLKKFNEICIELQNKGYKIGVISWLAKNSSKEYDKAVRKAKRNWLKKYLDFTLDYLHIVPYGKNKTYVGKKNSILFDDENGNIERWQNNGTRIAIKVNGDHTNGKVIFKELTSLLN